MKILKRIKKFYTPHFNDLIPIFENYVIDTVQVSEGDKHVRQAQRLSEYRNFIDISTTIDIIFLKTENLWLPTEWNKSYINWKKICRLKLEFEIVVQPNVKSEGYLTCRLVGYNFIYNTLISSEQSHIIRSLLFKIEDTIKAPLPARCHLILDHVSGFVFT
jgi:hypothetical protein